jgi:signal transduction histidine kinase
LKGRGEQLEIHLIKKYGNLPKIECYPGQLNQVFMNLIANAIDALEEKRVGSHGESSAASPWIQISTEVKDRDASLNGDRSTSSVVIIRIADNGSGMAEEVRSHLFEPFFTTKPMGKGTGLGLSISYRIIVEQHNGQLLVNSQLGQGTEFIIELPLR